MHFNEQIKVEKYQYLKQADFTEKKNRAKQGIACFS